MAADSLAVDERTGVIHAPTVKMWRVGGGLVGMAGNIHQMEPFIYWLRDGADPDDFPGGEWDAIVVNPRGRISLYTGYGREPVPAEVLYTAIGSGAPLALGALYAGADARTAVKAAIAHSTGSKGPVRVLRLRGAA